MANKKRLDPIISAYMRKISQKGAALGGLAAAASLTPEQRVARAKKAAAASAKVRSEKTARKTNARKSQEAP
jgi:hypothetical protein